MKEPTTCGYSGLALDDCKDKNCNEQEHIRDARSQGDRKWRPITGRGTCSTCHEERVERGDRVWLHRKTGKAQCEQERGA